MGTRRMIRGVLLPESDGIWLYHEGDGIWQTEDGCWTVQQPESVWDCDGPHPVRTAAHRGYWCTGGETHISIGPGWVWLGGDAQQSHDIYQTWAEAAGELARHLNHSRERKCGP